MMRRIEPPWPVLPGWTYRAFQCDCGEVWEWPMGGWKPAAGEQGGPPPRCPNDACMSVYFKDITGG